MRSIGSYFINALDELSPNYNSTNKVAPYSERRERTGPFGTTIFGLAEEVQTLNAIVQEYSKVFIDKGHLVTILKED